MRLVLIVAFAGCGEPRRETSATRPVAPRPVTHAAPRWEPVALTTTADPPIALTASVLDSSSTIPERTLATGLDRPSFVIAADVTARGQLHRDAALYNRLRCRVSGVNLHVRDAGGSFDARLSENATLWRAVVSLREPPAACEVSYVYRIEPARLEDLEHASHGVVVATACFDKRGLRDGACPRETFPAPVLPRGFSIGLTTAKHEFVDHNGGGIAFDGGVTFAETPRRDRHYRLAVGCEDGTRAEAKLEDGEWIDHLAPGTTLALVHSARTYPAATDAPGRCELVFESSGASGPARVHGTYCLVAGNGSPGPCARPFEIRARAEEPLDPSGRMGKP